MPEAKTFGGGATPCATALTDFQLASRVEDTSVSVHLLEHDRSAPFQLILGSITPLANGLAVFIAEVIDDGTGTYDIYLDGVTTSATETENDTIGTNIVKRIFTSGAPVAAGVHTLSLEMTAGVNVALYNAKLIGMAITCV